MMSTLMMAVGILFGAASGFLPVGVQQMIGVAAHSTKTRRRLDGSVEDMVCTAAMELVRQEGKLLEGIVENEGRMNLKEAVVLTAEALAAGCDELAVRSPMMKQCTLYITLAAQLDWQLLEHAWLDSYATKNDQQEACGRVVNRVNMMVRDGEGRGIGIARQHDRDVYITTGEDTAFVRRLTKVGGALAAVAGVSVANVIGHVCRSFDTVTNRVIDDGTI